MFTASTRSQTVCYPTFDGIRCQHYTGGDGASSLTSNQGLYFWTLLGTPRIGLRTARSQIRNTICPQISSWVPKHYVLAPTLVPVGTKRRLTPDRSVNKVRQHHYTGSCPPANTLQTPSSCVQMFAPCGSIMSLSDVCPSVD